MGADINTGTKKCTTETLAEAFPLLGKKEKHKLRGQGKHPLSSMFPSYMGDTMKGQVERQKERRESLISGCRGDSVWQNKE